MSILTPRTSSSYSPGMQTNQTPYGQLNHQQYVETLSEWMASMWAYGGNSRQQVLDLMSPVWYSAKFGEPDPTDQDGFYSPRTILSFSRFASQYTGGSPGLDNIFPYQPPTGTEFIETPEQTAARVAQANFERNLDAQIAMQAASIQAAAAEGAANRALTASEGAANRALSAAQTNAQIAAEMESIKGQIKTAAMSAFNQSFSNEVAKFGVEAGMYNNQQSIQSANLQQAGSLSSIFQQILDERTGKAIEAQLNPGDYLGREFQVRAMNAPEGTTSPAYANYDNLTKIIEMLMNTPGGVKPVAPDQNTFQPPPALQELMNWTPQAPAPVVAPAASAVGGGASAGGGSVAEAIRALMAQGAGSAEQRAAAGLGPSNTVPGSSTPGANNNSGSFSGVRNEDVAYLTPGQRAMVVTGLAGPSYGRDYTQYKVYDPNRNNYQYQPNDVINPGSTIWLERFAKGVNNRDVGGRRNFQFMSGDPQIEGQPNPEVVTIHNPGKKTKLSVDPVAPVASIAPEQPLVNGAINTPGSTFTRPVRNNRMVQAEGYNMPLSAWVRGLGRIQRFAYGANMFDPEALKLKSYSDEDYQNLPSLRFLQGRMGRKQYDTLKTGNAIGAFGQELPESGSINYGDYLRLAKDPVSLAMVASSYKAGSRDLFAEVSRAKARAPFGQAVQTSLIRS